MLFRGYILYYTKTTLEHWEFINGQLHFFTKNFSKSLKQLTILVSLLLVSDAE